jgi:prophage tail gpP-like protein
MAKAIAGAPYTIVKGDTLSGIAKQAYGDGRRWRDIWKANETVLRSGNPNLIYPGEVINIPGDAIKDDLITELIETSLPTIAGKDPDDFTLVVADREIPVKSGRAFRSADTAADGWTAVVNFDPDDPELMAILAPYSYKKADLYLGGTLIIRGAVYSIEPSLLDNSRTATLEGWSKPIDIVDSTSKAPYEAKNITLRQRALDLVSPLGIEVIFSVIKDEPFDRVAIEPTETIFDHLAKLASQRGILITSTELGELKFTQAASGAPVGTIEETSGDGMEFTAKFDGRKRYNIYKAIAQTPGRKRKGGGNTKFQISKDEAIPKSRTLTFHCDETKSGEMKKAADWRRSKQVADALTIPLRVSSWYGPDGNLWKENTLLTVKSKTIFVPDGFDFLIRSVEYGFDENGTTADLSLIPPQVYTGETIDEPWASAESRQAGLIDRVTGAVGL